jgi:diguanylate cyclase (GGDEF)-like protein
MDRPAQAERRAEDRSATRRRRLRRLLSSIVLVASAAAAGVGLAISQSDARAGITQRWDARTQLSALFVQTYVDQLFSREVDVSRVSLSRRTADVTEASHAFGFSNAVLLDARGALLSVYPAKPELLGTVIAPTYPHLTAALGGRRAVSPVVPAAANGQPVVGFALPFETPQGRRVFSGAYAVDDTPLAAYLERMTPIHGAGIYLVDGQGTVVTSSSHIRGVQKLHQVDPGLARASAAGRHGQFVAGDVKQYFAAYPVSGTPWTLLARVPSEELFVSVSGPMHYLPWTLLGVLVLALATALWLWFRRMDDHDDLRLAYARLDRLASQDGLTRLLNRRSTRTHLDTAHEAATSHGDWLSVLMVDVDHFKRINDTYGHAAGDAALVEVADRLRDALRDHDVLGRWGGEEFLVVLPAADAALATQVAERLRLAVSAEPVPLGGGEELGLSVSIGAASTRDAAADALVHAADQALYAAKAAGRDRVHALSP